MHRKTNQWTSKKIMENPCKPIKIQGNKRKSLKLIKIFENQNEYILKKNSLIQLNKENTWEKNKSKLIELINEN